MCTLAYLKFVFSTKRAFLPTFKVSVYISIVGMHTAQTHRQILTVIVHRKRCRFRFSTFRTEDSIQRFALYFFLFKLLQTLNLYDEKISSAVE